MRTCWVEIQCGKATTIFKNKTQAIKADVPFCELSRERAVGSIRRQVYKRADGECERCGKRLTWDQFHMDEKVPKGKGGLVSLENCWALCADCHEFGPDAKHGNRRWQSAKLT